MRLYLGEAGIESTPAIWDASTRPHGLLVGETGSGKSFLAKLIIAQATERAEVWVADGKGGGDFVNSPASVLALGPEETVELLDNAADESDRRMQELRSTGQSMSSERDLLVVVDELAAVQLRRRREDAKANRERKDRLQGSLAGLALTGRSARVHLLAILQRADTDVVPGAVRDQLGLHLALGWQSTDGYRMVFGPIDLQPPTCLDPGRGWIAGHAGHAGRPQPFLVRAPGTK